MNEQQELALKMLTITQSALQDIAVSLKETLDLINCEIVEPQPKKKARGVDYKILELMKSDLTKEYEPSDIVEKIRPLFPSKTWEQLFSTAYLALSRLSFDGHITKVRRGVYLPVVVEGLGVIDGK